MDWTKFIIRTIVSIAGAIVAYMTSTTPESFAINTVLWLIIQAALSSFASIPPEDVAMKVGGKRRIEISKGRKFLSSL